MRYIEFPGDFSQLLPLRTCRRSAVEANDQVRIRLAQRLTIPVPKHALMALADCSC